MRFYDQANGTESFTARTKTYPDGSRETLVCERPVFSRRIAGRGSGSYFGQPEESVREEGEILPGEDESQDLESRESKKADNLARSSRRAKARLKDIALSNKFEYFVTLTMNKERINRYDFAEISNYVNRWSSNQVQRYGISYVLVPERHKDGAFHYHGLLMGNVRKTDSGTLHVRGKGKPIKPRNDKERKAYLANDAKIVWNLDNWVLGFSTAIDIDKDYGKTIAYVCKYIGKQSSEGGKIGGRWVYTGGELKMPEITFSNYSIDRAARKNEAYAFVADETGDRFVMFKERA